ncbi:hypothetical protein SMGD1_1385 [Sulfurimonas gotlandica GD1]|uniref:Uncharacterized protein n=1 Tax=Sulfurimonas gotlandica (strain DSM 19862 / JCM 16533 / GD1) TaxID=929558 RepID=H1FSI1_SULGG|nr:hypothetical protein [Sulfurimonas gotlandica]EHP29909.1 hypothetical protein SMGD1_1385 [Sulfurimonas gotlandica GD1]
MDINSVPQDDSSTYANNKKAIYAKSENGEIKVVGSTGWNVEETVTKQALEDLEHSAHTAYCEVKKGIKSPLYYYMYKERMDLQLLHETTSFFKWTIRRDFRPEIFKKISNKRLSVYADALGKTIEELQVLEDIDYDCN